MVKKSGYNHLPMPGEELLPSGLPVALGRWFESMFFQNVGDRAARHFLTQVSQGSLDSSISPVTVVHGNRDDQLLHFLLSARLSYFSMTSCCGWFIHPAREIRSSRKGYKVMRIG